MSRQTASERTLAAAHEAVQAAARSVAIAAEAFKTTVEAMRAPKPDCVGFQAE